jgi:cytochrome P450
VNVTADLDPADPVFLADPHPVYDTLRVLGPMVRDPLGWSTIDYASSSAAFLDEALVPGIDPLLEDLGFEALWGVRDQTLTDSEGSAHERLRRAVGPWFTARRIARLGDVTRGLVDDCLAVAEPGVPFPVMAGLADVVPARLFCAMVGVGVEDAETLAAWSKALLLVFTAQESMVETVRAAKRELAAYTHDLLAHKESHPGDDLASALAVAAREGSISRQEAYYLLEELLSASVDNTANTTGLAVHTLAEKQAWGSVHRGEVPIVVATEECGRFQPAIRHTIKYAVASTEIAGTAVAQGEFVTIRIAAAHRDPVVYPDPHAFVVDRVQPKPQLAFGAGRHYCLGAALGRLEVQEMVAGLTSRWSMAEVADGARMSVAASGHVFELPLILGA